MIVINRPTKKGEWALVTHPDGFGVWLPQSMLPGVKREQMPLFATRMEDCGCSIEDRAADAEARAAIKMRERSPST